MIMTSPSLDPARAPSGRRRPSRAGPRGAARAAFAAAILLGAAPAWAACLTGPDADGDGVCDADEDTDHDGNLNDNDRDGDTVPNWLDNDDDDDGVLTEDEDADGDGDPSDDQNDPLSDEPDYLNFRWPTDKDHDDYIAEAYGGDDCNDEQLGWHPDLEHDPLYDGEDWDCDGGAYEYDFDRDGYNAESAVVDGVPGDDCNDRNADINPGATEDLETGEVTRVDRDCDGFTDPVGTLTTNAGCDCGSASVSGVGWLAGVAFAGTVGVSRFRRRP